MQHLEGSGTLLYIGCTVLKG